jgi:hypothetical protein
MLLAAEFRSLLEDRKPILVGTRPTHMGEEFLPHELVQTHAYEVTAVGPDNGIQLRNPWNDYHPEPMTPKQFMDNVRHYYTTLE